MDFPIEIQSEFDYIVRSYQFVAAMFSSISGYTGLLATLGAMGIFFGGMSAITSQAVSGRAAVQSWLVNMAVASAVVVLLISAKSTVIIHDTVTNQMRPVGGVPTVMATLAYMENRVELGVKEIMETVMSPIIAYDDIGKGEGFELLASMDKGANAYFTQHPHVLRSMENYFKKCVLPDLSQGWIPEKAIYGTDDMWNSIKSDTRTRYSLVFGDGDSVGTLYSCADSWEKITALLAVAQVRTAITSQCEEKYEDTAAVAKCESNVSDIVSGFVNGGTFSSIDLNSFIRSYLVSYAMYSSNGSLYSMLNDVNKKNASSAFMAEKMLPRLKGMMYGMIIGIFPLLVCFMWFSPSKTIVFYAGLFVLLILWSSIDTFLDMQYQNEVYRMFATMRKNGLGLRQMFDIPNIAADAMSLYGSGRWMALGLATAISAAITGINSYAISQMGSQLGATAQSAAGTGAEYMDTAGGAKLSQKSASDFGYRDMSMTMTIPNWNAYGSGQSQDIHEKAATSEMLANRYGGSENVGAANAAGNYVNRLEGNSAASAKLDGFGDDGLAQIAGDSALFNTASAGAQMDFTKRNLGSVMGAGLKSGAAQGLSTGKNINSAEGEIKGAGGVPGLFTQTKDYAALNTGKTGEYLKTVDSIYGNEAGKNLGFSEAVNAAANTETTKGKIESYGLDKALEVFKKQGAFGMGRDFGSISRYEESFGNSQDAGMAAGDTEAINGMRNMADINGRLATVGGDHGKLMEQSYKLGGTDQQRQMGSADALKHKAQLMGMNVRQFQKFTDNGNTLDADTAEYLNEKYNTDVFKENQHLSFNAGSKGLTEMSVNDNVQDKQVGGYLINGTQSIVVNDDGSAAFTRYDGIINGMRGSLTVDGNGNAVFMNAESGRSVSYTDTESFSSGPRFDGDTVIDQVLNAKTGEGTINTAIYDAYRHGEETGDWTEYNTMKTELASRVADVAWYKYQEGENWSIDTNAQVGGQAYTKGYARADIDSKGSIAGKVVGLLTGAEANAGVEAGAQLDVNASIASRTNDVTNKTSESMKQDLAKSIDNIMSQSTTDKEFAVTLQNKMSEYMDTDLRGKITPKDISSAEDVKNFIEEHKKEIK